MRNISTKLKDYFTAVGDSQSVGDVEKLLNEIANLKYKRTLESPNLGYTLTGHTDKVASVAISPDGRDFSQWVCRQNHQYLES